MKLESARTQDLKAREQAKESEAKILTELRYAFDIFVFPCLQRESFSPPRLLLFLQSFLLRLAHSENQIWVVQMISIISAKYRILAWVCDSQVCHDAVICRLLLDYMCAMTQSYVDCYCILCVPYVISRL